MSLYHGLYEAVHNSFRGNVLIDSVMVFGTGFFHLNFLSHVAKRILLNNNENFYFLYNPVPTYKKIAFRAYKYFSVVGTYWDLGPNTEIEAYQKPLPKYIITRESQLGSSMSHCDTRECWWVVHCCNQVCFINQNEGTVYFQTQCKVYKCLNNGTSLKNVYFNLFV